MLFSVGVLLTPWHWGFHYDSDEEGILIILGPFVVSLEEMSGVDDE